MFPSFQEDMDNISTLATPHTTPHLNAGTCSADVVTNAGSNQFYRIFDSDMALTSLTKSKEEYAQ
jgi:hypothetical protein